MGRGRGRRTEPVAHATKDTSIVDDSLPWETLVRVVPESRERKARTVASSARLTLFNINPPPVGLAAHSLPGILPVSRSRTSAPSQQLALACLPVSPSVFSVPLWSQPALLRLLFDIFPCLRLAGISRRLCSTLLSTHHTRTQTRNINTHAPRLTLLRPATSDDPLLRLLLGSTVTASQPARKQTLGDRMALKREARNPQRNANRRFDGLT